MRFYTAYDRPLREPVDSDQSTKTEVFHVPRREQVMRLLEAGERLQDHRRAEFAKRMYDFQEGEEPDLNVPLMARDPGVDMAEVSMANEAAMERLREQAAEARRARGERRESGDAGEDPADGAESEGDIEAGT